MKRKEAKRIGGRESGKEEGKKDACLTTFSVIFSSFPFICQCVEGRVPTKVKS